MCFNTTGHIYLFQKKKSETFSLLCRNQYFTSIKGEAYVNQIIHDRFVGLKICCLTRLFLYFLLYALRVSILNL
jgi:hypothetical protein